MNNKEKKRQKKIERARVKRIERKKRIILYSILGMFLLFELVYSSYNTYQINTNGTIVEGKIIKKLHRHRSVEYKIQYEYNDSVYTESYFLSHSFRRRKMHVGECVKIKVRRDKPDAILLYEESSYPCE